MTGRLYTTGLKPALTYSFFTLALIVTPQALSVEHDFSGLIDSRFTYTDSDRSYLEAGYGKFATSDDYAWQLAELGLRYRISEDAWSATVIANGYAGGVKDKLGITEAFVRYRGLPDEQGLRWQFRGGILYPSISMENIATAWSSPYTLNYSTQNTWIGEEVRHLGLEARMDLLGKPRQSYLDISLALSVFEKNDPTGALLSWHGWTMSSRQSIWGETIRIPNFPALAPGQPLEQQARYSDPHLELDDEPGYHMRLDLNWSRTLKLRLGYYDNRASDDIVVDGQYTWRTQFTHLGLDWRINKSWRLIAQHMQGDTRMRVANNVDAVGVDFYNSFLLATYRNNAHRFTIRGERFSNDEFDEVPGDNNDEEGYGLTLSYQYQLTKGLFLATEVNRIWSTRPSRSYLSEPVDKTESEWHLGLRYFF